MEDLRYIIALMSMKGVGSAISRHLINEFGSAEAIFNADTPLLSKIPRIGNSIVEQLHDDSLFAKADSELEFIETHHIKTLVYGEPGYPERLLDCPDAPELLFYLGSADLNSKKIISIVGTRSCTQSGKDNVAQLVQGIKEVHPDTIIVSGLAIGIDVSAHKAALKEGLPTVGVVAHGLDMIYPASHKSIARQMIMEGGGIITEYTTHANIEKGNFLARNRIIAGLADAVIVAESRDKGGSLVTASIALDYDRDVFAIPGRVNDERSKGCNRIIRQNRAGLITCAQDFLEAMGWDNKGTKSKAIQQTIDFGDAELSPIESSILSTLKEKGDLRANQISEITHLENTVILEALLDLEMNGKIRSCPGCIYQLK